MAPAVNYPIRPDISERAVDEALVQHIERDAGFASWLAAEALGQAGNRVQFDRVEAKAHVRRTLTRGETDIELRLSSRSTLKALLLIENKINAAFTPTQPQRYRQTCTTLVANGDAPLAFSVLLCPADYARRSTLAGNFDVLLAYEQVAEQLTGQTRELFEEALRRYETPYMPETVREVQTFFEGYTALCRERFPSLVVNRNANPNGERPAGSRTISFNARKTLPRYDFLPTPRFYHQCVDSDRPSVKIMITGWASHVSVLRPIAAESLRGTPFYIREAGRSLGIVADTPRLDNRKPVATQLDRVIAGLETAEALRLWFIDNEAALQRWAEAIQDRLRRRTTVGR